jgi:excisionase family DNA binding protein
VDRIVIIPLGNGDWIALSVEELAAHKAAALALGFGHNGTPHSVGAAAPLCTAEQLAEALQLPKTRIEQATRQGEIPCVRLGRWIRYRRAEVEQALNENK